MAARSRKKNEVSVTDSLSDSIVAVDLFCGAGGLTYGLQKSGIQVRLGVDLDPSCQYPYKANNKAEFSLKSVNELTAVEIQEAFGEQGYKLLAGCAPCQPFSKYRLGKSDETDTRWNLLKQFERLVRETKPDFVTMENVPRLRRESVFQQFVRALEDLEYHVWHDIVNCADYGVPQSRERVVLLASRLGPLALKSTVKKHKTVRAALKGLPKIKHGAACKEDPIHQTSRLSELNLKRIRSSSPGGTWRDWSQDLVAACHKKDSGKTYPSVYGRMTWDKPSPTITTQFFGFGNGRFGHPEQDRAISLREGAILQSFPKAYRFVKRGTPIHQKTIGKLIGNAVPVKLGAAIGKAFIRHAETHGKPKEPDE